MWLRIIGISTLNTLKKSSLRSIPACAENSWKHVTACAQTTVHPRLRGELNWPESQESNTSGSSPLARGTQSSISRQSRRSRFIPACAGNSIAGDSHTWRLLVHPRLRGELTSQNPGNFSMYGSSPLARGTRFFTDWKGHQQRFIPARAGNSPGQIRGKNIPSVHPRLRGGLFKAQASQ